MGIEDGIQEDVPKERKLYRAGSLSSQLAGEGFGVAVPLQDMSPSVRSSLASMKGGMRQRTASGKSIRSRIASRAEYHSDLKPMLEQGLTKNLLLLSFIIVFGSSFLFGYNIGVLNQPTELIQDFYNVTYTERYGETNSWTLGFLYSLTTAIFFPGGMIGAFAAGFLADRIGRKRATMFSQIFAILGAVISCCCVVATAPELLMLGRFITGINCGFATQLAPMYLTEIAPFNLRGAFGTANQLFITIGIWWGSVLGLRQILGTPEAWPYLLLFNAFPAIVSLLAFPFLPESPRYLYLVKKKRIAAEKALRFIRQKLDVTVDIEEMETESQESQQTAKEESYTMKMLLQTRELYKPLFVAVMLQVIQQFSGINAIFFYSTEVYKEAGVSMDNIQYFVMLTNAVNVLMTIIAVPVMDKAGRRPLLLYPMGVMVIILALITMALNLQSPTQFWWSYISIICVISYVISFAIGLGPIPMMIGAELFRQGPRPRVMSLAGLTNWFCTTVVAITYVLIQKVLGAYTFIIFLVLMVLFTIFVFFMVPETKGKTFEEIAGEFQPGGDIEVEEIVDDDVFGDTKEGEPEEDTRLVEIDLDKKRNRNGSAVSDDQAKLHEDEEKRSLTRSAENIHQDKV